MSIIIVMVIFSSESAEPLTRRERDILALLAGDGSNQEIADQLFMALSSVKWYTRQIYQKLGVSTRRQAVSRARDLGWVGAEAVVSPLRESPNPRHNLPAQISSFIGRELQIVEVCQHVIENRLVTLTGSGGVGKTRLALKVAEALLDQFADGVWLVELAEVTETASVHQAVAASLGLKSMTSQSSYDMLLEYLLKRQILLVLDNCEHLVEVVSALAEEVLKASPQVRILATSRERLRVSGESVYRVPSLTLPDASLMPGGTAVLETCEAVRLFEERARLVQTDFKVEEHNALTIAQICLRLEGIPLAIELASARLHVLTCDQLLRQLQNVFQVLTFGRRTAFTRHQTLGAVIDWSYRLLSEAEKRLLCRLSVFVGTFDLAAVEGVCCLETGEQRESLDLLTSLVDKSMLLVEPLPGLENRYRLLETVRQYARDKLRDFGESLDITRAHTRHYLERAKYVGRNLFSNEAPDLLRRFKADFPNVRAAFAWGLDGPEMELAVEALKNLWYYWLLNGSAEEGRAWLEKALGMLNAQQPSVTRTGLLNDLGLVSEIQGRQKESLELIKLSLEMARQLGDRHNYAWACLWMGTLTWREYPYYEESARIHRELGDEESYAFTLWLWGSNSREYGDLDQAERLLKEAEAYYLKKGSWFVGVVYSNLARLYYEKGNSQQARNLLRQSLPIYQSLDDYWDTMWWHRWWGEMELNDATDGASFHRAKLELLKTIRIAEKFGNRQFYLFSIPIMLANKALQLGELPISIQYYREPLTRYQNLLRSGYSDWIEGNTQMISQCLLGLAEVAVTGFSDTETSAMLLGIVDQLCPLEDFQGEGISPERIQRIVDATRSGLGEDKFLAAWQEGKTLSLDQAFTLALETGGR